MWVAWLPLTGMRDPLPKRPEHPVLGCKTRLHVAQVPRVILNSRSVPFVAAG